MKEFNGLTGGRYTYVEDVLNLQNLALAFGSIFAECNNFIISGCEVSDGAISEGYVYINGKIRHFSGATGISSWPMYIYELNSTENIEYVNGQSKVGRINYGCAIAALASIPATDAVTDAAPGRIAITSSGGLRLKNAFFGANCLLLQENTLQTITGGVAFSGAVNFTNAVSFSGAASFNNISLKTINGLTSTLSIANTYGGVNITAKNGTYVNIGPAIKEGGTTLESKYVKRSELQQWVFGNAPTSGITQNAADQRYARLTEGFTQFVNVNGNSPSRLRTQIGAIDQTTADGRYARLDQLLADMANNETKKSQIRRNIGAAAASSVPSALQDTGWIYIKGPGLYARQWGNMVSIQGEVYAKAAGEQVFSIPNTANISGPGKDISVAISGPGNEDQPSSYITRINMSAGSKVATASFCASQIIGNVIKVNINYMV
jgi:hypothetical protein